jgi:hypothetical protein
VLTLTLTLKTLGVVLHPSKLSSFHPASDADEASFEAFVKICQATDVCLHFARAQGCHDVSPLDDLAGEELVVDSHMTCLAS